MGHRLSVLLIYFSFFGSLLYSSFVSAQANDSLAYLPSLLPDRIILNVTEDTRTSMAVNWRTNAAIKESFAEIAVASADPRFVLNTKKYTASTETVAFEKTTTANYHSVTFEGLTPNTRYAYRVGHGDYWSEWFHFSTAASANDEFSFIYYGDVQTNIRSLWSRVAREAYAKAPNARLAMYAGDLINRANRDVEWGDWFYAGGFIHSMIPGFPSPGNHDHYDALPGQNTTSVFWRPQFNLPLNGPVGLEETCYYADIQGVRFISLNTDKAEEFDEDLEKQRVWLEEVLANNPNRWTCVTFHHPIYSPKSSRDNKRTREAFKPLFDRYKVDLVLQGHDHTYARGMAKIPMNSPNVKSGTMYVVSVSGPKMTSSGVEPKFWMDFTATYTQLFHVVTVNPSRIQFKTYTATGELFDEFHLVKQAGKINKLEEKFKR